MEVRKDKNFKMLISLWRLTSPSSPSLNLKILKKTNKQEKLKCRRQLKSVSPGMDCSTSVSVFTYFSRSRAQSYKKEKNQKTLNRTFFPFLLWKHCREMSVAQTNTRIIQYVRIHTRSFTITVVCSFKFYPHASPHQSRGQILSSISYLLLTFQKSANKWKWIHDQKLNKPNFYKL